MDPSDFATAGTQLRALDQDLVSSIELVDAAIVRIEHHDAAINAVVVRDFERARAAARAADAARADGDRRPLLGLPVTVKELFRVVGLPTSWGNPAFKGWQPDADLLAVARLKAAGAVILGKTNVSFMLADYQSRNPVYGVTNNPWDLGRTPGGSSGGSAAALAAGFVALELGSDFGGSLRTPAHFCGVYAHKPSLDLVPLRGGGPPHTPDWPFRGDLAVAGPMARSAADLMLALNVLAGPDEQGAGVGYQLMLPPPRHDRLQAFRVLVLDEHPLYPTAASVRAAVNALAGRLVQSGCRVTRENAALPDLAAATLNATFIRAAHVSGDTPPAYYEAMQAMLRSGTAPDATTISGAWIRGSVASHRDWLTQMRERRRFRMQWHALMREVDVVLCPAMPTPAFPHDPREPQWERRLVIDGRECPYTEQSAWIGLATSFDAPATVAPIGRSDEGLPIGVQIIGAYLEDRTTIAFAELIEREFGGFVPPTLG